MEIQISFLSAFSCFALPFKRLAMMSKSRLFFAMRDKFRLFEKVLLCWVNDKVLL